MRLLKKINNNYAVALDSKGEEIIVEGKGIGFNKMPCDLTDLSLIKRTYYNVKDQEVELLKEISEDIFSISVKIFEYALQHVGEKINPKLPFILADHIQFSIERFNKNIEVKVPFYYDIEYLYPKESMVATYALEIIFSELHVLLPEHEKVGITMNVINSELFQDKNNDDNELLVELCVSIVEKSIKINIKKDTFNYSRFVSHLHYLFKRKINNEVISSENIQLYKTVSDNYPEVKKCVDIMANILAKKKFILNEEEKIYLMMHVNRLWTREDCNHLGHNPTLK